MRGSYICDRCNKSLASRQSLWNHRQRCNGDVMKSSNMSDSMRTTPSNVTPAVGRKRSLDPPSLGGEKKIKNPKIQALLDAVIDDGITDDSTIENDPLAKKMEKTPAVKEINKVIPPLPLQVNDQDESGVDEDERDVDDENREKTLCEECELAEMVEDFKKLYSELINEGRRENVPELMNILCIWRDAAQIDQEQYKKLYMKINAASMKDNVYSSDESLTDDANDDDDDDHTPLDASAVKRLRKRFKLLHYDLINKGHKMNAPILRGLLDVLKDEGCISNQMDYEKAIKSITDYL